MALVYNEKWTYWLHNTKIVSSAPFCTLANGGVFTRKRKLPDGTVQLSHDDYYTNFLTKDSFVASFTTGSIYFSKKPMEVLMPDGTLETVCEYVARH